MSGQVKTRPSTNQRSKGLRDIRMVISPSLTDRLRRYCRQVGIEDTRDYVRYCVMITTQLLQLAREDHHICVVGDDGQICYEIKFDSSDLGFDVKHIKERLESFEF